MPMVVQAKKNNWDRLVDNFKRQTDRAVKEIPGELEKWRKRWEEYKEDVRALPLTVPMWWESYKEDLQAVGVNNFKDWIGWVGKNIVGAAVVVLGGKLFAAIGSFVGAKLGGLGKFAFQTAGLMAAVSSAPVVTSMFQGVVQQGTQALNFDIMQTDEELFNKLDERIKGFYGLFGQAVGSALGWLVCGALPNTFAFRFNKSVATAIAQDLDENARAEMYGYIASIINLSTQTLLNAELVRRYTSLRRELKKNPDSPTSKLIRKTIGEDRFKKWGQKGQEPWTIKKNIIEAEIEKETDPGWKAFKQQGLDGFTDACIEAAFITANNLDTFIASQKIARTNMLGQNQVVRLSF